MSQLFEVFTKYDNVVLVRGTLPYLKKWYKANAHRVIHQRGTCTLTVWVDNDENAEIAIRSVSNDKI